MAGGNGCSIFFEIREDLMRKKLDREFHEMEKQFDEVVDRKSEYQDSPWFFLRLHSILHKMTANRVSYLFEQLNRLKIFLILEFFAYIPILVILGVLLRMIILKSV